MVDPPYLHKNETVLHRFIQLTSDSPVANLGTSPKMSKIVERLDTNISPSEFLVAGPIFSKCQTGWFLKGSRASSLASPLLKIFDITNKDNLPHQFPCIKFDLEVFIKVPKEAGTSTGEATSKLKSI